MTPANATPERDASAQRANAQCERCERSARDNETRPSLVPCPGLLVTEQHRHIRAVRESPAITGTFQVSSSVVTVVTFRTTRRRRRLPWRFQLLLGELAVVLAVDGAFRSRRLNLERHRWRKQAHHWHNHERKDHAQSAAVDGVRDKRRAAGQRQAHVHSRQAHTHGERAPHARLRNARNTGPHRKGPRNEPASAPQE